MSKKSFRTPPRNLNQDEHQHALAQYPSPVWFDLAKPSRLSRKPKRGWKHNTSGYILTELLGLVALALVAAVLLVGTLQ